MKIVTVILARGGSKGIPKKNIIDVNGLPLIAYTINASIGSKTLETWVSTNCEDIASISEHYGANILWRPAELATDKERLRATNVPKIKLIIFFIFIPLLI